MKVADSVRRAIDDFESAELESAMMHACNAVDGTGRKLHPKTTSKQRFTGLLRDNLDILGAMGAPGIDLAKTVFPVHIIKKTTHPSGKPDIADVLYDVHRCFHAHGEEVPAGFELIQDASASVSLTRISITDGRIRLSDRMIFALVAVAVLSPCNHDQVCSKLDGYFLTLGGSTKLIINEWWGRSSDFEIVSRDEINRRRVALDFGDWTSSS